MNNRLKLRWLILCCMFLAASVLCAADTKLTVRMSYKDSGRTNSNVQLTMYYRSGAMRRKEVSRTPLLPTITNCATR